MKEINLKLQSHAMKQFSASSTCTQTFNTYNFENQESNL